MSNLNEYLVTAIRDKAPTAIEYALSNNMTFEQIAELSNINIYDIIINEQKRVREETFSDCLAKARTLNYPLKFNDYESGNVVIFESAYEYAMYLLADINSVYSKSSYYFSELRKQLFILRQYCFVVREYGEYYF